MLHSRESERVDAFRLLTTFSIRSFWLILLYYHYFECYKLPLAWIVKLDVAPMRIPVSCYWGLNCTHVVSWICIYSNVVPTTCQQDVFALLVPSLMTVQVLNGLLATCCKVADLNRLVTSRSNNLLYICSRVSLTSQNVIENGAFRSERHLSVSLMSWTLPCAGFLTVI